MAFLLVVDFWITLNIIILCDACGSSDSNLIVYVAAASVARVKDKKKEGWSF